MERWADLLKDRKFRELATQDFDKARQSILNDLSEVAGLISVDARRELPDLANLECVEVTQTMIDELDQRSFDLEQAGNIDKSNAMFVAARFASACLFIREADSMSGLMNAAYEAKHAHESIDH